jgi:aminoglycoside 3-N-acetyltransferase I
MNIRIERPGVDGLSTMRALNALFAEVFEERDTYLGHPADDTYLARWLDSQNNIPLCAWDGDILVGGLVAYRLDKFEQARSEIYIYDLAVAESHRQRGIATALIERLREIARECGAWAIYVQADYGDDPAIALYTKLGVREDVMHFDILP